MLLAYSGIGPTGMRISTANPFAMDRSAKSLAASNPGFCPFTLVRSRSAHIMSFSTPLGAVKAGIIEALSNGHVTMAVASVMANAFSIPSVTDKTRPGMPNRIAAPDVSRQLPWPNRIASLKFILFKGRCLI